LEHVEQQPLSDFESVSGPFPPFAAFENNKVIGTAGFYILGGPKMSHRGVLRGMYVDAFAPSYEVGHDILAAVIEHARGRVDQIHLHVVTTNSPAYRVFLTSVAVVESMSSKSSRLNVTRASPTERGWVGKMRTYLEQTLSEKSLALDP
jgi:hypothetical protein